MAQKTVLEIDLVGYSDVARTLEQNLTVEIVAQFNDQIQGFVDMGLAAVGTDRSDAVRATTGDGAILVFDQAADAHRFAAEVHEAARKHNSNRKIASAQRWFRIGMATGELHERPRAGGGQEIAGTVIPAAVRLEAAGRPGQIVADLATFALLPEDFQSSMGRKRS